MNVLILGTGDAFTKLHFGTSALIEAGEGEYILIDCPDPIHRVIHEATTKNDLNIDVLDINHIILTHLHGDHSNGLESFGFYRRIARRLGKDAANNIPHLYTTQPVADRLWEKLAPAMDGSMSSNKPNSTLSDFFELHIIDPGIATTVAGLTIDARFTQHPIPTIGLRVSDGESMLGWSSDTPFEQEHIDWLSPADVIIHECNLGDAHTHLDQLEQLPADLKKKMLLIHTRDDFDSAATTIRTTTDGQLLTVANRLSRIKR